MVRIGVRVRHAVRGRRVPPRLVVDRGTLALPSPSQLESFVSPAVPLATRTCRSYTRPWGYRRLTCIHAITPGAPPRTAPRPVPHLQSFEQEHPT